MQPLLSKCPLVNMVDSIMDEALASGYNYFFAVVV